MTVTFLFSYFFGFKISNGGIRLESENDQNGALFILKDEKKGNNASDGLETGGKSWVFSYFFVSLFFFYIKMWSGRYLFWAAGLEWIIMIKRTSENKIPQYSDIDIFSCF